MSSVSLPGLISAAPEPVVGVASKKSAVDSASSDSFGSALNKALPPKHEASKPAPAGKGQALEQSKGVAESTIQESTTIEAGAPSVTGDGVPVEPVKPESPSISDDANKAPDADSVEVEQDPVAPQLPTSQDTLVAPQPLQVPGLTSPAGNSKDFKVSDNTVGSSVLASIQMSKALESQKSGLPVQSKDAPKDIASVAAQVKQAVSAAEKAPAQPENPFGSNAKADAKAPAQLPPAVAPSSEQSTQSTGSQAQALPAGHDPKVSSPQADTGGMTGVHTAAHVSTQSQSQAQALSQPTAPANLTAQVATQEWNKGFGQQLVNMHLRGDQTMELHLHPQDLGPISISLKVNEMSQAHAQFFSHNAQVRTAIEQALPQLKEAMAEQGISLGQTSVGDQRQQQSFREPESHAVSSQEISDSLNLVDVSPQKSTVNQRVDGQISTYA